MPKVFRAMKRDDDGLPTVGPSASALGVRTGVDIDVDQQGNAVLNHKGMTVSPSWRMMSIFRIPKRLGGQGSNNTHCFTYGDGPFQQSAFGRLRHLPILHCQPGYAAKLRRVVRPPCNPSDVQLPRFACHTGQSACLAFQGDGEYRQIHSRPRKTCITCIM